MKVNSNSSNNTHQDNAKKHTYMAQLIIGMRKALTQLDATPTNGQLESWAIFIHESMSISSRNYHSVRHVFDLTQGWNDDPIGVLAAYFHDCTYYHVDGGLSPCQKLILEGVFTFDTNHSLCICNAHQEDDQLLLMVDSIFRVTPGQPIQTGFNEFLSAVSAVRLLAPVLTIQQLAQIACCIEGTIPFRVNPMEQLFQTMTTTNDSFQLGFSNDDLIQAVQRTATLANRDVANFGSTDTSWFLDNTWSLLPETNETLRQQHLYTVKQFQYALFKLNGFFSTISPSVIFVQFRGVPSNKQLTQLTQQATRNVIIGKLYVGVKLLALTVLAAIAELTGGDAPMSFLMGDLPSRHSCPHTKHSPVVVPEQGVPDGCDADVYHILAHGRMTETSFDIRQSPLAAYLYSCLKNDGVIRILQEQTIYPLTQETSMTFLKCLPSDAVCLLGETIAKVAVNRAERIRQVIRIVCTTNQTA